MRRMHIWALLVALSVAVVVSEWRTRRIVERRHQDGVAQLRELLDPVYVDMGVSYRQDPASIADVLEPLKDVLPMLLFAAPDVSDWGQLMDQLSSPESDIDE